MRSAKAKVVKRRKIIREAKTKQRQSKDKDKAKTKQRQSKDKAERQGSFIFELQKVRDRGRTIYGSTFLVLNAR